MSSYKTHEMIEDSKITFLQISSIAAKPKYINETPSYKAKPRYHMTLILLTLLIITP